jgi:hypothetical protein
MTFLKFDNFLRESQLNEIGEGTTPFEWKRTGPKVISWISDMSLYKDTEGGNKWQLLPRLTFEFSSEKATYTVFFQGEFNKNITINFGSKKSGKTPPSRNLVFGIGFDIKDAPEGKEALTNFNEQFRVISTVTEILASAMKELQEYEWLSITEIHIGPKKESGETDMLAKDTKRGRLYLAYIQKQARRLKGDWTVELAQERFIIHNRKISSTDSSKYIQL